MNKHLFNMSLLMNKHLFITLLLVIIWQTSTDATQVMNCTFSKYFGSIAVADSNMCGFTQGATADFHWDTGNSNTMTPNTGPSGDNSGTPYGHFAYIESSFKQPNSTARLDSPSYLQPASEQGGCVQFYYHMYGSDIGTLTVTVYDSAQLNSPIASWQKSGNQGNLWLRTDMNLNIMENKDVRFQVIIEVTTSGSSKWLSEGDIAIDDVIINTDGTCAANSETVPPSTAPASTSVQPITQAPSWSCNFNSVLGTTLCGMRLGGTAMWKQSSRSLIQGTGPQSDQSGSGGQFAHMAGNSGSANDTATMDTPQMNGFSCLQFYYHMYGEDMGQLKLYVDLNSQWQEIWSQTGDQGDQWNPYKQNLPVGATTVRFEAIRGQGIRSDIAVDEILLTRALCDGSTPAPMTSPTPPTQTTTRIQPTLRLACSFDNDQCNFYQSSSDSADWTRLNTPTWSSGTGPDADHTKGDASGYYMYLESSYKANGTVARMSTGLIDVAPDGQACLRFHYHMYGTQVGTLAVNVKDSQERPIATKYIAGNQGNKWNKADLDLTYSAGGTNMVYIEFVATIKHSGGIAEVKGDIAIDDVILTEYSSCNDLDIIRVSNTVTVPTTTAITTPTTTQSTASTASTASTSSTLPPVTLPTTIPPVVLCGFENDALCGFTQDRTDDFDWSRLNQPTWTRETGPDADHTTGKGYFMYIESSIKSTNDKARFISPIYEKIGDSGCVYWYYYMYGKEVATLNVYIRAGGSNKLLYTKTGDQGQVWLSGTAPLDLSESRTFQIVFEGTIVHDAGDFNVNALGDIAIDDVSVDRMNGCGISIATDNPTSTSTTTPAQQSPGFTSKSTKSDNPSITSTAQSPGFTSKSTKSDNPSITSTAQSPGTSKTTKSASPKSSSAAANSTVVGRKDKIVAKKPEDSTAAIAGVVSTVAVLVVVLLVAAFITMRRRQMWMFAPGTKLSVMFSRQNSTDTAGLYDTNSGIDNPDYVHGGTLKFERHSDYNGATEA